jgi:hypothetical protein
MRSISAALTAAQKEASRAAYVVCEVKNQVENVRRLDFADVNTTANAAAKHDIAVAADGSVQRVRVQSGTIKHQRVTDPGTPSAWDSWTDLATSRGSSIAVAARGARVIVVYTDTVGLTVYYRESTDSGQTFGAETTLTAAPGGIVVDLAAAYKDASGEAFVAWCLGASMRGIKRAGGTWGSVLNPGDTFASLSGIAMTYAFDYEMVITGQEATTSKPTVWTRVYGDGVAQAADTWSGLQRMVQAEVSTAAFTAPSLDFVDTYRANFTEIASWTGGQTRHYRTWLHASNLFTAGPFAWRTPLPSDNAAALGLAVAHGATHVYESGITVVRRAARAAVTLDVSSDVLALELVESALDCHGWIEIVNAGAYAGPPAPLQPGNLVAVSFGYHTASGAQASRVQDLWITAIEHRVRPRTAGEGRRSTLRLHVEGGLRRLQRSMQRFHISHPATEDYRAIISAVMLRAGLALSVTSASARSDSVTPWLHIAPEQSGAFALRAALAFLADRIVPKASGVMALHEPLASDASAYTLGAGPEHPLYALTLRDEPPAVSETMALSFTSGNAYLTGQAHDHAAGVHGLGAIARVRDLSSDTTGEVSATASAHLRQRALDERAGELVCPPICGLELLDVLTFSDPLVSAAAQTRRVAGITWRLDRARQVYEQRIALGVV